MLFRAPRNPLVFPYGVAAGVDPNHPACGSALNQLRVSVVPGSGGAFINLLNGQPTTPAKAGGTAHVTLQGPLGQAVYGGSDNNQRNSIPGVADAPGEFTSACIIHVVASTANGVLFTTNGVNTSGARQELGLYALDLSYRFQGTTFSTGISLVAGRSYFVAFSGRPLKQAVVVLDLATGQLQTFTDTDNITMSVGQATYAIGGQVFGTGTCGAHVYALMYGTKFLPLQTLLAWAQDPWAFWYPQRTPWRFSIGIEEAEEEEEIVQGGRGKKPAHVPQHAGDFRSFLDRQRAEYRKASETAKAIELAGEIRKELERKKSADQQTLKAKSDALNEIIGQTVFLKQSMTDLNDAIQALGEKYAKAQRIKAIEAAEEIERQLLDDEDAMIALLLS